MAHCYTYTDPLYKAYILVLYRGLIVMSLYTYRGTTLVAQGPFNPVPSE